MTDALRSDRSSSREAPDRERDARVEALLVSGLDHYFSGQYELAINVWTRVLFLDRGHARARAYIERARSAVAERQREADELRHAGATALHRGELAVARQLLTAAIERGASGEEALALLQRIDRIEAAALGGVVGRREGAVQQPAADPDARPSTTGEAAAGRPGPVPTDSRLLWLAGGLIAGVLLALISVGYLWIISEPIQIGTTPVSGAPAVADPLPVPTPGELRVLRARVLVAEGKLREALALLESASPSEGDRPALEELRAAVQRRLIDAARQPPGTAPGRPPSEGVSAPPARTGTAP